jgi:serine/threonine-protein kinase
LEEKLGAGGMGEVYLATDLNTQKKVAVKIASNFVSDKEKNKLRFEREIKLIKMINNPAVVRVLDSGSHQDTQFYVMDHIPGKPLSFDGNFENFANLLLQIAGGLEAIHRQCIVHRDIKPSNILVANGQAIIVDFGIASSDNSEKLTKTGSIVGTINYMSPEQVLGVKFDKRSDLYSFGVVIHELLTGTNPFETESSAKTIFKILQERPTRPSLSRPDIPKVLENICMRLLEKDPDMRYQDALELEKELALFVKGERFDQKCAYTVQTKQIPFIGRKEVLSKLIDLLDFTRFGNGKNIAIIGDQGIGKSRLLEELRSISLSRGAKFFTCDPAIARSGMPAISTVLDNICAYDIKVDQAYLQKHSRLLSYLSPTFAKKFHIEPDAPEADDWPIAGSVIANVLLTAFSDSFSMFAFEEGLDIISKTVMELLSRESENRTMMVIAVSQKAVLHLKSPLSFELAPLSELEVIELAKSVIGFELSKDVLPSFMKVTSRKPLNVIEVARNLTSATSRQLPITGTTGELTKVFTTGIAKLSKRSRWLLERIVFLGRPIPASDLQAITGLSDSELFQSMSELQTAGFVKEKLIGISYMLESTSTKLSDTARKLVAEEDRKPIQLELAETLEHNFSQQTTAYDQDIGWHYLQAGNINKAAHYLTKSARFASKNDQTLISNEIVSKMVPIADSISEPGTKLDCFVMIVGMLMNTSKLESDNSYVEKLESMVGQAIYWGGRLLEAYKILVRAKAQQKAFDKSKDYIQRAWLSLGVKPTPMESFDLLQAEAYTYSLERNFEESKKVGLKMLRIANDLGDIGKKLASLNVLAVCASNANDNREALRFFGEIKRLAQEDGRIRADIVASVNMCWPLRNLAELNKATQLMEEAKNLAISVGLNSMALTAVSNLPSLYRKTGNIKKLRDVLNVWEELQTKLNTSTFNCELLYEKIKLSIADYRIADAKTTMVQLMFASEGKPFWRSIVKSVEGSLAFITHDYAKAKEKFQETVADFKSINPPDILGLVISQYRLACVLAHLGEIDQAMIMLVDADKTFQKIQKPSSQYRLRCETYRAYVYLHKSRNTKKPISFPMFGLHNGHDKKSLENAYLRSDGVIVESYVSKIDFFLVDATIILASAIKDKIKFERMSSEQKIYLTIKAQLAIFDAIEHQSSNGFRLYSTQLEQLQKELKLF